MRLLAVSTAALLTAAFASSAQAQQYQMPMYPRAYAGADAMFWELDPEQGSSADSVGLRLNGGAQFNDYFGAEAHLGTGGSEGSTELDYLVGAYAKGILPVSQEFRLYGLAGFTEVDFDADRESGFSYGGGAEFDIAPNLAVGADYMRYLDKSDYTFDAASVGVRYRF
ncbi:porin family protein [Halomonas sp. MCCC 1A17488]|uniref:Porin family protein n=1 Tax=Billgrantia sulfidoxydans TaxID=2733484 RepID=A0ABX7W1J1_9GAMM|nr:MULTISPECIES: porin family protein [Halomonas]MCE8016035.1 porin family protein [Halomonas sp. MCCC 1A17488]MCG3239368.1 porin family protein [Halomonas sp. MCCC 1A17488]QPP50702.1 porin family protein [Halomonas sp. SS10-MC5]QTP54279.1 porin family protein [Halomonas sulfidoxydans]